MNILKLPFWLKIDLIALMLSVCSCDSSQQINTCQLLKRHDSLIIINHVRETEYLLADNVPTSVKGFGLFQKEKGNFYVYLTNRFYRYSALNNKVTDSYQFEGDNQTINDDTVYINNIKKFVYLNSISHHFLFDDKLSKYYDLDYLIHDSLRTNIISYKSHINKNIIHAEFTLRGNKTIKRKIDLDTLKLIDR